MSIPDKIIGIFNPVKNNFEASLIRNFNGKMEAVAGLKE